MLSINMQMVAPIIQSFKRYPIFFGGNCSLFIKYCVWNVYEMSDDAVDDAKNKTLNEFESGTSEPVMDLN